MPSRLSEISDLRPRGGLGNPAESPRPGRGSRTGTIFRLARRCLTIVAILPAAVPALGADLPAGGGDLRYSEHTAGWRRHGLMTQVEIDCLAEWRRLNPPGAP